MLCYNIIKVKENKNRVNKLGGNKMKEIVRALENKGYMVCNQFDGYFGTEQNLYEVYDSNYVLVDDNMTLEDLKKML